MGNSKVEARRRGELERVTIWVSVREKDLKNRSKE
jgi:hypothetical protein